MKILKNALRIVLSIFVFEVIFILLILFLLFAINYTLIRAIFVKTDLSRYFYMNNFTTDQSAGVYCQYWFNDWMIKSNGHRMGNPDETISYVMGQNVVKGTLYPLGYFIANTIDFIFYMIGMNKWKRHCLDAASNLQNN